MLIDYLSGPLRLLVALLLTIAIEVTVAILFGYRKKSEIWTVILINLITNPLLNYLLVINIYFWGVPLNAVVMVASEIVVVLVEWVLLRFALQQDSKKLFALSLAMNFCSFIVGFLISFASLWF